MEALQDRFGDRVAFFMVYIHEAHPTDGWQVGINERERILFEQPKTFERREEIAHTMCTQLEISLPCLVDGIDNKTSLAYTAAPDRMYVIGIDGRVVYKGKRGPWGFKPAEIEESLERYLPTIEPPQPDGV